MSRWFIIGGGESINSINLDKIPNKNCIVVNNVWRLKPEAEIMFFSDPNFYHYRHREWWRFKGQIYTSLIGANAQYVKLEDSDCNSGQQAIRLAFHLGASKVVLVGFDGIPGRWGDNTPYSHKGQVLDFIYKKYIEQAERLKGLPIINTGISSAYPWFKFIPLETLLTD